MPHPHSLHVPHAHSPQAQSGRNDDMPDMASATQCPHTELLTSLKGLPLGSLTSLTSSYLSGHPSRSLNYHSLNVRTP